MEVVLIHAAFFQIMKRSLILHGEGKVWEQEKNLIQEAGYKQAALLMGKRKKMEEWKNLQFYWAKGNTLPCVKVLVLPHKKEGIQSIQRQEGKTDNNQSLGTAFAYPQAPTLLAVLLF
jgi:hypothetical protein